MRRLLTLQCYVTACENVCRLHDTGQALARCLVLCTLASTVLSVRNFDTHNLPEAHLTPWRTEMSHNCMQIHTRRTHGASIPL